MANIQCSSYNCQALNPLDSKYCHQCRTPILKRYLRILGNRIDQQKPGKIFGDRYLLQYPRVVLDLKISTAPETLQEVPEEIVNYLKLSPYRLHIPQIYGKFNLNKAKTEEIIWLLEYSSIPTDEGGNLICPELFPQLQEVWAKATGMRQLNWLWQLAKLWQPMQSKGVVSSLLNPHLLAANDRVVQLLELQADEREYSLKDLGDFWHSWIDGCAANIQDFLAQLIKNLREQSIEKTEHLIDLLEEALQVYARSQDYTYRIFTLTDSGPNRPENEDNCYPPSGNIVQSTGKDKPLAIVCDGIGGHEGGEIASMIAINCLQEQVNNLALNTDNWNPNLTESELENFVRIANDAISSRNDSEQRHERQRMGTTIVMALAQQQEIYLTNVGDSRIYWITSSNCHQVTVDDDLASREVRLGYAFYRDAMQYPSSGALVQALGMNSSNNLYPNVQRLTIDEECVFLLCSDGLSDFDRIEQYWREEITPIIKQGKALEQVAQALVNIANNKNGHDNVTVALIHCRLNPDMETPALVWSEIEALVNSSPEWTGKYTISPLPYSSISRHDAISTQMPTQPSKAPKSFKFPWLLSLALLSILALAGMTYVVYTNMVELENPEQSEKKDAQSSNTREEKTDDLTSSEEATIPDVGFSLSKDRVIQLKEKIVLKPIATQPATSQYNSGIVPKGSILKVLEVKEEDNLTKLLICQLNKPELSLDTVNTIQLRLFDGKEGWAELDRVEQSLSLDFKPNSNHCKAPSS